ncbi:tetratricopeptide repeat protein [Haemophilus parahaemolyticus]
MKLTKTLLTTALLGASVFSFQSTSWADTPEQQFQQGLTVYEQSDYQTAFKLWLPVAEQGYAPGQFILGLSYILGKGVQVNKALAKEWLGKACDNGDQQGCEYYGQLNRGEL